MPISASEEQVFCPEMPISASEEPFFCLGQKISAAEIHVFCLGLSFSAPLELSFLAIVVIVHVVFSRFLYIIYIYAREGS